MTDKDLTPLADRESALKHEAIFDRLKLDLKIAVDGTPGLKCRSAEDICRTLQNNRKRNNPFTSQIYSAASAVFAHEMYFRNLTPHGNCHSIPSGKAAELLAESFGSLGNFFYLARTHAGGSMSPGFLWLYKKTSRSKTLLGLARLPLYSLPDLRSCIPLMAVDLWEHAYMSTWGRDISGFTDACLRQTNWNKVFGITPSQTP